MAVICWLRDSLACLMRAKSVGTEDLSMYLGRDLAVSLSLEGGMVRLYNKIVEIEKMKY